MNTLRKLQLAALGTMMLGAGASAQVRASLPTPSDFNKPRATSSMPSFRSTSGVPSFRARSFQQPEAIVGAVVGGSHRHDDCVRAPVVVTNGTGLTVNGSFSDDNFNVAFHLGSGFVGSGSVGSGFIGHEVIGGCPPPHHDGHGHGYGHGHHYPYRYPSVWYNTDGFPLGYQFIGGTHYPYYLYDGYQYPRSIDGTYAAYYPLPAQEQAEVVPAEPVRELTPVEQAGADMHDGDYSAAREAYARIVQSDPEDHESMRRYALSLLLDKEVGDGVAVMAMAYKNNPDLASTAFESDLLADRDEWRKAVRIATTYANRTQTGSSWLLVAVLMQAEGRDELAARMVARAEAVGVESTVYNAMKAALQ